MVWDDLGDEIQAMVDSMIVCGDPDTLGATFSDWKATGVDGFTVSLPANGHLPERVALLGQVLSSI
ncbi:MAG: hypothetical protein ACKOYM_11250, partial [Actinomycetes bacterium]